MHLISNPASVSFDPISFLISNPSLIYIILAPSSPQLSHPGPSQTDFHLIHILQPPSRLTGQTCRRCAWHPSLPSLKPVAQLFWTFGLSLIGPAQPPCSLQSLGDRHPERPVLTRMVPGWIGNADVYRTWFTPSRNRHSRNDSRTSISRVGESSPGQKQRSRCLFIIFCVTWSRGLRDEEDFNDWDRTAAVWEVA